MPKSVGEGTDSQVHYKNRVPIEKATRGAGFDIAAGRPAGSNFAFRSSPAPLISPSSGLMFANRCLTNFFPRRAGHHAVGARISKRRRWLFGYLPGALSRIHVVSTRPFEFFPAARQSARMPKVEGVSPILRFA